jgi:hypothetical protein
MQAKKVSEPTFLHQIKRCFGILFGLSAQVNLAFIFDINTNLNEIKSTSHAMRNIIPSNNGLGVEKIVMFLVTGYFVYFES